MGNFFIDNFGTADQDPAESPVAPEAEAPSDSQGNYFLKTFGVVEEPKAPEPPRKETWKETLTAIPGQVGSMAARTIAGMRLRDAEELQAARIANGKEPDPGLAELIKQNTEIVRLAQEDDAASVKGEQNLAQKGVQGAASSLAVGLPALATGIVTRNPALAVSTMYEPTSAQKYGELRVAGVNPESARKHGDIQGLTEVGTELIPGKQLFKPGSAYVKRLANYLMAEVPGESLATITQALDDKIAKLPGDATADDVVAGIAEGFGQLPETLATIAFSAGPTAAIAHGGVKNTPARTPTAANPVDAIEEAHDAAMKRTAEMGGDKLDQVLAGARVKNEVAAEHDETYINEAHDQNAIENAMIQQEQELRASTEFQVAEEARVENEAYSARAAELESQRARDYFEAEYQKEMQAGETAQFEKPADEPLATLGDLEVKTKGQKAAAREAAVVPEEQSAEETIVQEQAAFTENEQAQEVNNLAKRREIESAAHEAATSPRNDLPEPSEAQVNAGNYKKGHVKVNDFDVTIENPRESTRSGKRPDGTPWSQKMQDHYGYIRRTEGADGDQIDTFVGENPSSDKVYVVDQIKQETGGFDEHKVMMGYNNQLEAVRAYKRNFEKGWKVGPVKEMTVSEFRDWVNTGDSTRAMQPEKISEAVPASAADVETLASRNAKRGKQDVRYALSDYEKLGTNATTARTFEQTASDNDRAAESAARVPGRGASTVKLATRRAAFKAPEKGIAVLQTGDSEWTVFNDRKPGHTYTKEQDAYDDLFGADADARAEIGLDKESTEFLRGWGVAEPGPRALTKEEAQAAVEKEFPNAKELNIHVHPSYAEMPDSPAKERLVAGQTAAKNLGKGSDVAQNFRGIFDPPTGEVHVFADKHQFPEQAVRTAIHEVVAHKGLKVLLKDRMASTMQDVYDNASAKEREGIKERAERYALDISTPRGQQMAAEEYVAKLSEFGTSSSALQRLMAVVRGALRRMGLVKGWTDEDIKALLRKARSNLDERSAAASRADAAIRYALGEPDPIVDAQPKNPLSQLSKLNATMESQAKYSPALMQRVRDSLANFGESKGRSATQAFLATIPRDKLPDFADKKKLPSAQRYVDTAHKMDSRRNALLVAVEKTAKKWSKLQKRNPEDAALMGEIMHAATLAGVDPSVDYVPRKLGRSQTLEDRRSELARREQFQALKPFWDKLSPEGKALYAEVKNTYAEMRRRVEDALERRINEGDASPDSKRVLLDTLRKQFESGKVAGPYFPLARFGEYWASAKQGEEVIAASRFETPQEQKAWRTEFTKAGYTTDGGRNMDSTRTAASINPEFVAKVTELVGADKNLADSIWQMYMETLPEMSMRKAFIHRKGRLGFSGDALRAFGNNMFHSAHQLARLEYVHRMEGHMNQMEKQVRSLETAQDPEAKWARPLMSEMNLRHEWAMNPSSSPIVAALTTLGFAYHLMVSPAAGLVNLSQTPIVAMPILAGEFGFLRTNRALLKAAAQVAGARIGSGGKQSIADKLTGDEQKAMQDAETAGSFGRTQAHMLAGATNEEAFNLTDKRRQAMEIVSWVFHKSEEFNRKVTFLAAFRLAKQKGMDYDQAYYTADKLTMDSHFDVSNANRARVMQSGPIKVLTLFKNYSLNMTYRLARDFREAIRTQTDDPAKRQAAQKRFAGMMGMTAMMAGASGMPLAWLVHWVINTIFSDPDSDFDSEDALRAHLTESYGSKAATAITRGPFEAATGLSVSDRVGLNNLWVQAPPENMEGADLNRFYLEQAAGPALSPFLGIAPAVQSASQGHYDRALEKLMPKAGSDIAKAFRYMREGAVDNRGNVMMEKDEFTAKQVFFQSMGFVPEELATRNAQSRAIKGAEQKLLHRKNLLMDRLFLAVHTEDQEQIDEARKDIGEFNKKNPSIAIGAEAELASFKSRARFSAMNSEGTTVDPKLSYLHKRYKFTPEKKHDQ